jgi:hypothetical protein
VRVYGWKGQAWVQKGADIDGAPGDGFGWGVGMSADGSTVAIGALSNDDAGTNAGAVRVYVVA